MAVAGEVSYLRRFAGKFVEIVAAGIGTAVSGYLVAYVAGHFSLFAPATSAPAIGEPAAPPQAISSPAETRDSGSIEATVRAALSSHEVSRAAPIAATPQPLASPETPASVLAAAPPLTTAEIRSMPVAAAVEPPPQTEADTFPVEANKFPAETDAWPSDQAAMRGTGRRQASGFLRTLPPQPPPANGNLLTALKRFF
jgi:hypothetical protein